MRSQPRWKVAREGLPANPRTWLISTGRFKAIDRLRRSERFDSASANGSSALPKQRAGGRRRSGGRPASPDLHVLSPGIESRRADRAHPARGLRTHNRRGRALFSHTAPTLAQGSCARRRKIRDAESHTRFRPFQTCRRDSQRFARDLSRLQRGIPRIERRFAHEGGPVGEAIRLGRLLVELLPEPEAIGFLALMLLHEARRPARASSEGELKLLEEQDRSLWNREQIEEGSRSSSGRWARGGSALIRSRRP